MPVPSRSPSRKTQHGQLLAADPSRVESPLEPEDRIRIEVQLRFVAAVRRLLPYDSVPYLGHMRIAGEGRVLDVLLVAELQGAQSDQVLPGVAEESFPGDPSSETAQLTPTSLLLIDWQRSELAEVFFSCPEGEAYELVRKDQNIIRGSILERNLVAFDHGELVEVITHDYVLSRRRAGTWERVARESRHLEPRAREVRKRVPSLIDVTLDPAQNRVVTLPQGRSVLVLGEAGHGKTTVVLHRLAHLEKVASQPFRAVVIVPTDGLRRLIEPLMKQLGLNVDVKLYEAWAVRQARHAFSDIPRRESQDTTAGVIRIKRDPALRSALTIMAKRRPGRINDDKDTPARRSKAWARYADLQHLFGDRVLMQKVAARSKQNITPPRIAEILEHTHVQFSDVAEEEYAHVDRERLVTLDGRVLDDGTPMQDAGTIDTEDYAVLFELDRLRAKQRRGEPTRPRAYDCIVLDEAQEFAPLELVLIGRSLAPGGTLMVAGDADQQLDPAACFSSWEQTMHDLGCQDYERVVLDVGYRCPPEVVSLARRLIDRKASTLGGGSSPASDDHSSSEVHFPLFDNDCHLACWLIDELRELEHRDHRALVGVICQSHFTARRLARVLSHGVAARLVLDGRFSFRWGINVTSVEQVKGLEFDYVIVPDASAVVYPDTPPSRRALYVAATRARHQLVLAAVGAKTPLVP